ncbi:MAG TPA: hypothetical protein PKC30_06695 [Saprospiraceae bacterium]|nr:hypothetical protein [Saprospiraceae bacterium]
MNNEHLSDDIIQAYILDEIADKEVSLHISSCFDCRLKLESYQILMMQLNTIEPEVFSFDAASLVMYKIEETEKQRRYLSNYAFLGIIGFLILGVLVFFFSYISHIVHILQSMTIIGNVFLFVSAFSVFLFLLADILRDYKEKEKLILQ